jgi:hypothetical protein
MMRLFVRAAGWGRGYYWTEVTAAGVQDAGQVPVEYYFDLLRNQDSLIPSLSLYQSAARYHVLCLGLATRRNEPARRVIGNSLLLEWPEERPARLFAAAVLAVAEGSGTVFRPSFEQELDRCIDHDATQDHYRVDAGALRRLVDEAIGAAAGLGEPDAFPDDVFLERLFARNSAERRRELQAALCRYELPALPPGPTPRLLLAVASLEDAERLCALGAWVSLSERCPADAWTVYGPPGQTARPPLWERC